ncbi:MAG: hypothetical protein WAK82_42610 [Streptosporangiaceae bacterium]
MADQERTAGAGLRAPRAAAVAGIVFSLLLSLALVLINVSVPSNPASPGVWLTEGAHRTAIDVALNLVPIAGITFLGFIGVARDRIGQREDRFSPPCSRAAACCSWPCCSPPPPSPTP